MKKIVILIGNYCSGKTEIAMNMAMLSASQGKRTQVIDLDRINDYFRMSDHIQMLIDKCINVVSPSFVGKGLTQTVMPAQVASPSTATGTSSSSTWAATRPGRCPSRAITRTSPRWSRASWRSMTS